MPQTDGERIYVIISLFVGASFFSYIVGTVCGVISKMGEKARTLSGNTFTSEIPLST